MRTKRLGNVRELQSAPWRFARDQRSMRINTPRYRLTRGARRLTTAQLIDWTADCSRKKREAVADEIPIRMDARGARRCDRNLVPLQPSLRHGNRGINMSDLIDYMLLGGTLICAFGTAFALQKATLDLILRVITRR